MRLDFLVLFCLPLDQFIQIHRLAFPLERNFTDRVTFIFFFNDLFYLFGNYDLILLGAVHQTGSRIYGIAQYIEFTPPARFTDLCHEGDRKSVV